MYNKSFLSPFLFLAFIISTHLNAEERIWTNREGTKQIKGEYVGSKGMEIELKLEDGSKVTIPLDRFSQKDRTFIRQLKSAKPSLENDTIPTETPNKAMSDKPENSPAVLSNLADDDIGRFSRELADSNGLTVLNGLPVIYLDHFNTYENLSPTERMRVHKQAEQALEKQQRAFGKLLERVALSIDDSWLEEHLPSFIANHFPQEIALTLIEYKNQTGGPVGIWKGRNEFEKRAAKSKFESNHRKELDKLAIKSPFRICFVSQAKLSDYDFARKGLVVAAKNKGGEPRIPGYEWQQTIPSLPSASYHNQLLTPIGFPVVGTTFWPVSPEVVQKLPQRTIGRNRIQRWVYVATVVTFKSDPFLAQTEKELLSLFGKVESIGLYTEPTLQNRVYSFPLECFPYPFPAESGTYSKTTSSETAPFDEFALAGLIADQKEIDLHDRVWKDVWNHTAEEEQKYYRQLNKMLEDHSDKNDSIPLVTNSNGNSSRGTQDLNGVLQNFTQEETLIDRLMHPIRPPFFPPYDGHKGGRYWDVEEDKLTEEQQNRLKNFFREHATQNENQFRLTLNLSLNPKNDEPSVISLPLKPELSNRLEQEGANLSHYMQLDENLFFDERGKLNPDGTRTGLFHAPGTRYLPYRFLLNFGAPVEELPRQIPENIVTQALSQASGESRTAVFLDVKVTKTTILNTSTQTGASPVRPCVVFDVQPINLSVGEDHQSPVFNVSLTRETLRKSAEFKPTKPIPGHSDQTKKRSEQFTPQSVLPLFFRAAPKLLESSDFVDQLMVMRWKLENTAQFGVTSDGVRFFDKGSNQLPVREKRTQKSTEFKTWAQQWADTISGEFAFEFESFSFEGLDKERSSPAILNGGHHGKWVGGNGPQLWHTIYDLKHLDSSSSNLTEKEAKQLLDFFAVAPPYVCLEQQFVIPNTQGETWKNNFPKPNNVPGLNRGKPVEPIFPVVHFDKEIWPPENATMVQTNVKPKLEVVAEVESVDMQDELPAHHWLETYNRSSRNKLPEDWIIDQGRYALINVKMKSARLINPVTREILLPLELKDYRPISAKPVK